MFIFCEDQFKWQCIDDDAHLSHSVIHFNNLFAKTDCLYNIFNIQIYNYANYFNFLNSKKDILNGIYSN